jgi:hypothetical protein
VEHVTKIVNEYNDIVGKLTTAEVRVSVVSDDEKKLGEPGRRDEEASSTLLLSTSIRPFLIVDTNCDIVLKGERKKSKR